MGTSPADVKQVLYTGGVWKQDEACEGIGVRAAWKDCEFPGGEADRGTPLLAVITYLTLVAVEVSPEPVEPLVVVVVVVKGDS